MMKKLLSIIILGLLLSGNSYAIENWEIKKVTDNKYIEISTEGLDVKGAKYNLLIKVNGESIFNSITFTFYATKNKPGIMLLPRKKIRLESLRHSITSKIIAVVPILSGSHHVVWISNGAYELDGHTKFISEYEKMKLNY